MTVWMIVGVSVVSALLALTLRSAFPSAATALTLVAGVMLLCAAIRAAVPVIDRVSALLQNTIDGTYSAVLLKALGISLLSQTAADVCRDAGESALAAKAELGGQVLLLVCALPLFEHALELLQSIISGQAVTL